MDTHPQPTAMHNDNHPIAIILAAFMAILSALSAALMPAAQEVGAQVQEVIRAINVMDDARLRLVCVAGSIGGALVSVLLFQMPKPKAFIAKLIGSGLAGVIFSP